MKYLLFVALLSGVIYSCKKYTDPKAVADPRLTNPYCNDPAAVNYNVGFPGKPDNTVCYYPSDLFKGVYFFHDSIYLTATNIFLYVDSFTLTIQEMPNSNRAKIKVTGMCQSGDFMTLTAGPTYVATLDTSIRDTSVVNWGQTLCRSEDTVAGTFTRDRVDSAVIHIYLRVASDTGVTTHIGDARKL